MTFDRRYRQLPKFLFLGQEEKLLGPIRDSLKRFSPASSDESIVPAVDFCSGSLYGSLR